MKNEDYIKLYEYLTSKEDLPEELIKIESKLELIVEQIKISDEYNSKMDEINNKFQELNK